MSVKNHPTTETKKPKSQSSTENAGTVLVFWFFWFFGSLVFCFFGFLVFWFFVFLVFWFFGFLFFWFFGRLVLLWRGLYSYISIKPQKPKNQRTKKPKNQKTKKPKNQKTKKTKKPKNQRTKEPKNQKTKTVPAFSVELCFFGFLVSVVGWFFTDTFGGLKLDTPEKAD